MGTGAEDLAVRPGEVLGSRYRVERVLGQGGMGIVLAARHVELGHRVALKLMLPHRETKRDSHERFLREARAAVHLKSQHVAKVLDVGTFERGKHGARSPYIVMEYLEGTDLDDLLDKCDTLPPAEAVEYLLQACEALAEAHAHGIIHRDLKPANLFVTANPDGSPCIKVLDFGLSKLPTGEGMAALTRSNSTFGSPLYMSPEQMRSSKNVDERSDIWALGAIGYEMLNGMPPFVADSVTELCAQILEQPPRRLDEQRGDLPAGLSAIIMRCLDRDPARRWPSVVALAEALASFAPSRAAAYPERISRVAERARESKADVALAPAPPATPPGSVTAATWGAAVAEPKGSRRWVVLIAAAGLVALLAVGLLAARRGLVRPDAGPAASADGGAATRPDASLAPATAATTASAVLTEGDATATAAPAASSVGSGAVRQPAANAGPAARSTARPQPAAASTGAARSQGTATATAAATPTQPAYCATVEGRYRVTYDAQGKRTEIPKPECF